MAPDTESRLEAPVAMASLMESVVPSRALPSPRMPSAVSRSVPPTLAALSSEVDARPEPLPSRSCVEEMIAE